MTKPIRIPLSYFTPAPAQPETWWSPEYRAHREKEIASWYEKLEAQKATFRPALDAAFNAANGRADSFTISAWKATDLLEDAEARLDKFGVSKKDRIGAELHIRSAGPKASAYKYTAAGTEARFVRRSNAWELLWVKRVDVYPKQAAKRDLYLSDAAHRKIAETAMRGFRLKSSPVEE